jgi:pyrophosphatase PpaX
MLYSESGWKNGMKIECLIFDVDGTLLGNSEDIIRLFQDIIVLYLGEDKKMSKNEVLELWGPPGDEIFKKVFPVNVLEKAWNHFLELYEKNHTTEGFFSKKQINQLKKFVPYLTIFTGTSKITLSITLKKLNLIDTFDLILTGNDVEKSKPYPDAVFYILEAFKLHKNETLFIGDSHLDIMAGKAAGIKTAAALWGAVEPQRLIESKPDYIFDTPHDFLNFVMNQERLG